MIKMTDVTHKTANEIYNNFDIIKSFDHQVLFDLYNLEIELDENTQFVISFEDEPIYLIGHTGTESQITIEIPRDCFGMLYIF